MTYINDQGYQGDAYSNSSDSIQPARPNNHLALSIVATVVSLVTCCGMVSCIGVVLGIIAIVFSTQVDSKYFAGDYIGAENAARNAKILSMIALGTIALSIILIIVSIAVQGGISEFMERYQDAIDQYC